MDNFFEHIKDNLENRPEPAFKEADWIAMSKKLDDTKVSNKRPFPWIWLMPLFCIPLIFSNFYLYNKLQNQDNYSSQLTSKNIQNEIPIVEKIILKHDTIYIDKFITRTKVVYKEVFINSENRTVNLHPNEEFIFTSNTTSFDKVIDNSSSFGQKIWNLKHPQNKTNTTFNTSQDLKSFYSSLDNLPLKKLERLNINRGEQFPNLASVEFTKKIPLIKKMNKWLPSDFSIGLFASINQAYINQLDEFNSQSFGISFKSHFNDNLSLFLDFSYHSNNYKLEVEQENNNGDIEFNSCCVPIIESSTDNFSLNEIKVHAPYLQQSLGLTYQFRKNKKFRPLLGMGITNISYLKNEVNYKFEENVPDDQEEFEIKNTINQTTNSLNYITINSGIGYYFDNNFSLQIDAFFRKKLQEKQDLQTDLFGVRTSFYYNF